MKGVPAECPPAPLSEPEAEPGLLERLFVPAEGCVPIIHPDFKNLGRIWVPVKFVIPTVGLQRFLTGGPRAPSLCMLHQRGRCQTRLRCNQIHVAIAFVNLVAHLLTLHSDHNCCRAHGDPASLGHPLFAEAAQIVIELHLPGAVAFPVPLERLARTAFWGRFPLHQGGRWYFTPYRVCQLHQQNRCAYGLECKNVHLCREWWRQLQPRLRECWNTAEGLQNIPPHPPPWEREVPSPKARARSSPLRRPPESSPSSSAASEPDSISSSLLLSFPTLVPGSEASSGAPTLP
eukprot:EG_transcript_21990